jgi:thiamine pyrophosphate-dependent acetolactate synthase large subunit-like protein
MSDSATEASDPTAARSQPRTVGSVVGETLARLGVDTAFALLGTSNFTYTTAFAAQPGTKVYPGRHENGVVSMATAWARVTRRVGVCSIAKGAGLTHAMSAIVEAHKSHTPLLVVVGDTPRSAIYSNPAVAQHALVTSVGVIVEHVHGATTAAADVVRAFRRAERERSPVVLMVSTGIQNDPVADLEISVEHPTLSPASPSADAISAAVAMIEAAERPVILAGRGAVIAEAGDSLRALGERIGALYATSLLGRGIFAGDPYSIGISGGYATRLAVDLLHEADLVLAFGVSLNAWTTRAGDLYSAARIMQVDVELDALSRQTPVELSIHADATATAAALCQALAEVPERAGFRRDGLAQEIASRRWRDQPAQDISTEDRVDPRALTLALEDRLPKERTIVTDGGGFMAYSVRLEPCDADGWVFPVTYICIGTGLPSTIGAAIARPDRLAVGTLGDASALMALADLETLVRLDLAALLVIYNDAAHGGEVGHYEALGLDASLLRFPDFDFAAVARAAGANAITVRRLSDLAQLDGWLTNREGPMVVDAKIPVTPGGDDMLAEQADWVGRLFETQGF